MLEKFVVGDRDGATAVGRCIGAPRSQRAHAVLIAV
jgi:hypothetical protein